MRWFVIQHQIAGTVSRGAVRSRGFGRTPTAYAIKEKAGVQPSERTLHRSRWQERVDSHFRALLSTIFCPRTTLSKAKFLGGRKSSYPRVGPWHVGPKKTGYLDTLIDNDTKIA